MFIFTGNTINFHYNGKFHTAQKDHPKFHQIKAAAMEKDYGLAESLIDNEKTILNLVIGTDLSFINSVLYYKGDVVHGVLGERILDMVDGGYDASPLILFMENLLNNPSKRAVDELYGFMEVSGLPITVDGHFLAYKSVRNDFTDKHSGTFDNSVGSTCEMIRNKVDENKDRTCAQGLHFAAHEYAKGFGGGDDIMVVLKINPRDVVAIPSDYNNQKGRCCKYTVVSQVAREDGSLTGKSFVGSKSTYVPPVSNYADSAIWGDLFDTFNSDKKTDFPIDRDMEYELRRESTGKVYSRFVFSHYDEKNDNLIFKSLKTDPKYCTVKDLEDWTIEYTGRLVGQ